MEQSDIIVETAEGVLRIAINRPPYNAIRSRTVEEMIAALNGPGWDKRIRVVVLTGVGEKAFCVGGDQRDRAESDAPGYGGRGLTGIPTNELLDAVRRVPKPVIARVNGYAIGFGNILATNCDLTIAAEHAQLGQVGPRVGSVSPGWGSSYLARIVGEKRAREFWYLCRRYTARQAMEMGLVNAVVPYADLDREVAQWCDEIKALSPTALAIAKSAFNAASAPIGGLDELGHHATRLYYETDEAQEGMRAFLEKRRPDFDQFQ